MGNTNSRSMTYHQYYDTLRANNPAALQTLDLRGLDPYQVLGVRKNFTFDELKEAYRNIARIVHPDKGGTDQLFQMVTDCFRTLAKEYKLRTSDRPHWELKQESERYYDHNTRPQPPPPMRESRGNTDDNFLDRFNRLFDDNKLNDDETSAGYGHMMAASSKKRDDISVPRIINKFNEETFHKTFDAVTLTPSKQVITYKEPEALPLARKIQYTELGADKPGDYSSGEGNNKRTLQYTDYMVAHTTTRLVDPRAVKERRNYKNVEQYENDRAQTLSKPMSEEERHWMEEKARAEEFAEQQRIQRLSQRDQVISSHHQKVNQLMLGK